MLRFCAMGIVFGMLWALPGCAGGPSFSVPGIGDGRAAEEQRIGAMLASLERNVENRRLFGVLAHISRGYVDNEDRDYDDVQAFVKQALREYRRIRVTRTSPQIYIDGRRARVAQPFGLSAEPADTVSASPMNLQGTAVLQLEKVDSEWRIVSYTAQ